VFGFVLWFSLVRGKNKIRRGSTLFIDSEVLGSVGQIGMSLSKGERLAWESRVGLSWWEINFNL
jgi:hypothetical protein